MFLPISDSPNPRGVPFLTIALIAANVLVYLLLLPLGFEAPSPDDPAVLDYFATLAREVGPQQAHALLRGLTRYDLVVLEHGFRPGRAEALDLLTCMFLHAGFMHLAGNMLFLWIYGNNVELRLGRAGYLAAYLGTGLAAALGDAVIRAGSELPSVGASGAISGVLGAYFVWFPENRVRLLTILFPIYVGIIELRARLVLGAYVILDNILPVVLAASRGDGGGGVAHGAHLGGFFAGALLAWGLRHLPDGPLGPDDGPELRGLPDEPGAALTTLLDAGRTLDAARLALRAPRPAAFAPHDLLRLAEALVARGEARAGLAIFERVLVAHPTAAVAAHLGAARVLLDHQPTVAYQHVVAALELRPSDADAFEARRLLAILRDRSGSFPARWG